MIGIKSIASYVPAEGVDNYAQGASFGKDEDFILGKIGSTFLPRKADGQETSDLCVEAANKLFASNPQLKREEVDVLIVVTQNGDEEGLPHTAAIVQDKLGLSTNVAAFDISLGCSGYAYGIYAIKGFMEAAGLKNGLLITADPTRRLPTLKTATPPCCSVTRPPPPGWVRALRGNWARRSSVRTVPVRRT